MVLLATVGERIAKCNVGPSRNTEFNSDQIAYRPVGRLKPQPQLFSEHPLESRAVSDWNRNLLCEIKMKAETTSRRKPKPRSGPLEIGVCLFPDPIGTSELLHPAHTHTTPTALTVPTAVAGQQQAGAAPLLPVHLCLRSTINTDIQLEQTVHAADAPRPGVWRSTHRRAPLSHPVSTSCPSLT